MRHLAGPIPVALFSVASLVAVCVAACGGGATPPAAHSEAEKPPALRPEPPDSHASAGQDPVGRDWFWPTRACTSGPDALVLANDCTCGDPLVCTAHVHDGMIDLHTTGGQRACKDCGVASVRCTLPVLARPRGPDAAAFAVTLNGSPLIDRLSIRPTGQLNVEACAP